jgi:proton-translocating NADH-quinone oxidoreductase chain N
MDFLYSNNEYLAVLPEIFLIVSINLVLLYGVIYSTSSLFDFPLLLNNVSWLGILILIICCFLNINNYFLNVTIFSGLLIIDSFGNLIKNVILFSTACVIIMSLTYNRSEKVNSFELPILILITIFGTLLLISSYDLMSMYLAIELQSFCSYILSSFKRNSEFSAESGLKYFILGAFSSGFLLFGCSLVYGFTGTTNYELISLLFVSLSFNSFHNCGIFIGLLFIFVSFLFKISAAPFHVWSPDVYEGSPTNITAFFAIVPKLGILVFFLRLFFDSSYLFIVSFQGFLIMSSIASMLIGSFGAIWQIKIKRLLAFSAIGHVGYMLIGLCCCSIESIYAVIFYCLIYVMMSILSFSLILTIRKNSDLKKFKYIEDLTIVSKVNPFIGVSFLIVFFSIAGIPPFGGFFSKMFLFFSAISQSLFFLTFVAIVCSVFSCFYYLRILQIAFFEQGNQWISLKSFNKEVSILISFSAFLLTFFFLHPVFLVVFVHNSVISLFI